MRTANRRTAKIAPALLFGAITFLQPVPEARADIAVQDREVLEAVEKVAPTVEEIAKTLWELSEVSLLEGTSCGSPTRGRRRSTMASGGSSASRR